MWRNTYSWKTQNFEVGEDKNFSQLHNNCVLLSGIPKLMDPDDASVEIKRILNIKYGGKISHVKVVGDFNELYEMGKSWQTLKNQQKTNERKMKQLFMLNDFES